MESCEVEYRGKGLPKEKSAMEHDQPSSQKRLQFSTTLSLLQRPPNSLRSKIPHYYVQSDFSSEPPVDYVPQSCIDDLVTETNIIHELDDKVIRDLPEYDSVVDWIRSRARKAFLITIDSRIARTPSELFASMQLFQFFNFEDSKLPWTGSTTFPGADVDNSPEPWIQGTWNRLEMKSVFAPAQWKFLAPFIGSRTFAYRLQPEQILPFALIPNTEPKEGTFGCVYPVRIHASHTDHSVTEIAVKVIKNTRKSTVDAAWSAEVRVLESIRNLGNPHLINCMAAIERGSARYLLFPWAGGGSLREYWDTTAHSAPTHTTIEELLSQLQGLASALRELHYFGLEDSSERTDPDDLLDNEPKDVAEEYSGGTSIRHGDLKPENLLWFFDDKDTQRCLKIADMGLAKRHAVATQDRSCLTSTRSATVLYEAPETELSLSNKPRSRQYDIWSMGCIIMEWIIWILYGNSQLQRFYADLKGGDKDPNKWVPYYVINKTGFGARASLHPQVTRWMTHIKMFHPECQRSSAIKDLIRVVEEKLLIVDLPPRRPTTLSDTGSQSIKLLTPNSQDNKVRYRATSIEFEREILWILDRGKDKSYLLTSTESWLQEDPPPLYAGFGPSLRPDVILSTSKIPTAGRAAGIPGLQTPSARVRAEIS